MSAYCILIADDEAPQRKMLAGFLRKQEYRVLEAADGQEALRITESEAVDLVLSDMRMPGLDGLELLRAVRKNNPALEVIVMTAFGSIESAVEAMRAGAFTFISKPVDLDALLQYIDRALERRLLHQEVSELRARLGDSPASNLLGVSEAMREVFGLIARVAPSRASVLIQGESGTGKELVARAVHRASPRAGKPFVPVNVAAIPESLLESQLFGHRKGSFTGAISDHTGLFQRADGGTLFIDELGDMPAGAQVKLLRVLQEGCVESLGAESATPVDVRVIAATHRNLESCITEGRFREDLYYRLNVIRIDLPALRERRSDIPVLVEHFVSHYASQNAKNVHGVDSRALDLLMRHHWPGNVRELENAIESAVVLCRGELLTAKDLPTQIRGSNQREQRPEDNEALPLPDRVALFERRVIEQTLSRCADNRSEAARQLGMSEKNIRDRQRKWEAESE